MRKSNRCVLSGQSGPAPSLVKRWSNYGQSPAKQSNTLVNTRTKDSGQILWSNTPVKYSGQILVKRVSDGPCPAGQGVRRHRQPLVRGPPAQPRIRTRIRIHAHPHTRAHPHTHAHAHTHPHTHTRAPAYARAGTSITRARSHTCTRGVAAGAPPCCSHPARTHPADSLYTALYTSL